MHFELKDFTKYNNNKIKKKRSVRGAREGEKMGKQSSEGGGAGANFRG